jgi:hypothetical protein
MRVGLFSKLLVVAILLILLSIVLPVAKVENVDAILASATFLYGIFYGFEAAVVLQNFSSLKSLVSAESASILALWNLSQILPKNAAKEIEERIEHYLVLAIENPLTKYVQATNREFFAIFEPLKKVKTSTEAESNAMAYMHESMYYLPQTRNQISQVAPRDVDPPEWAMLIILGSIIIVALFLGRDVSILSQLSAAIFSLTVVGSLLLLDEIDSNKIQEEKLEFDVFNDTLVAMGKERYYPKRAIHHKMVSKKKTRNARVGIYV